MSAARAILRPFVVAATGFALAIGAMTAALPADASPAVTSAPAVEQEPGWDYQTCATHGVPARQVEVTNDTPTTQSWNYWVDGEHLTSIRLAPIGGPYTYALPPVPSGEHRWQYNGKYDEGPVGEGELITTPECPEDPDLPDTPPPSEPPSEGFTMLEINEPTCRLDGDGVSQTGVGFHHLNGDSARGGTLEIRVDDTLADSYVVPEKSGRKGWLDLAPGTHTVSLKVAGQGTTKTAEVEVGDCSTSFTVDPSATVVASGDRLRAEVSGAVAGEHLDLHLSGVKIGEGLAGPSGRATLSGVVPEGWKQMSNRTLAVKGAAPGRTGTAQVSTVAPRTLAPTVWKSTVPRGSSQRVSVTGLVPGERVVVIYGGRWITPSGSTADAQGRYTLEFDPEARPGRKTVTVRGHDTTRQGAVTFTLR